MGEIPSVSGRFESLACFRRCVARMKAAWPGFLTKRSQRLQAHPTFVQRPCEQTAEGILEHLFTAVLDWPLGNFTQQVDRADIVLSDLGIKRLVVETKRPGALVWNRRAVEKAIEQAAGYASEQGVACIAVSDGVMLYATDLTADGWKPRAFVRLDSTEAPIDLWWLSTQGIWRRRADTGPDLLLGGSPPVAESANAADCAEDVLFHPKYKRPARCFAYVGDLSKVKTWKLPYLLTDGEVDSKRLPKAIQCILTDYRDKKVAGIPEEAIPAVLTRLAEAASRMGRMPPKLRIPPRSTNSSPRPWNRFSVTDLPAANNANPDRPPTYRTATSFQTSPLSG